MRLRQILRHIGDAEAGECRVEHLPRTVENELTRRGLLIATTASIAIINVPQMAAAKTCRYRRTFYAQGLF